LELFVAVDPVFHGVDVDQIPQTVLIDVDGIIQRHFRRYVDIPGRSVVHIKYGITPVILREVDQEFLCKIGFDNKVDGKVIRLTVVVEVVADTQEPVGFKVPTDLRVQCRQNEVVAGNSGSGNTENETNNEYQTVNILVFHDKHLLTLTAENKYGPPIYKRSSKVFLPNIG